ncbi:hypothetical protein PMAYCL1PPCAC_07382 [Pristionchus mayeri]|uniref:Uncharacterized protein n=1 Tax=Pristionchus mayeri TaxID=1317129 RepID=A0AAN5CBL2_9BILA|nr:hypothetical protein PMAYCL1PPCAC_07382 [Pristionchus mayeri]
MRLCIHLLILFAVFPLSSSNEYFGEFFGTSDVALLTQQNCARLTETDAGQSDRTCPNGLSDAYDLDKFDALCQNVKADTVRSHLVRDVHRKHKPRVLFVYVNNITHEINYGIEKLSLSGDHIEWTLPETLKQTSHIGPHLQKYESLEDSIFDTQSNILYLITRTSARSRKVHVVYVSNIFYVNTKFEKFSREFTVHPENKDRFDWVENPYEHTVYYIRRKENPRKDDLCRLPISELLSSLIDGKEGEIVTDMPAVGRSLIWAHKGVMITLDRVTDDGNQKDVYFTRNSSSFTKLGRRCNIQELDVRNRKTRRLITVFDWDYCILAHGGDGTRGPGGRVCPIYYNDLAVIENTGSGNTLYIVAIVLMFVFIVLLLVYVCWLRRNLDDSLPRDEHKPVPYYPSGQPLDSTFDMSVDRWDQY